jgi:beta-glucosidase
MLKNILILAMTTLMSFMAFAEDSLTPEPQYKFWTRGFKLRRLDAQKSKIDKCKEWDIVFIGDSITQFFEESLGKKVWNREFVEGRYQGLNLGISGDRTQNVLWRFDRGFLDGYKAKVFTIMIGTNNTGHRPEEMESPGDTIAGIKAIIGRIRAKHPESKIILNAIFPCGADAKNRNRIRNELVNREIKKFADGKNIFWLDFNPQLLNEDGTLKEEIGFDRMRLHIGAKGYEVWAANLKPILEKLIDGKSVSTKIENPKANVAEIPVEADIPQDVVESLRIEDLDLISTNRLAIVKGPCFYETVVFGSKSPKGFVKEANKDYLENIFPSATLGNLLWVAKYSGLFDGYFARNIIVTIESGSVRDAIVKCIKKRQPQAKIIIDEK